MDEILLQTNVRRGDFYEFYAGSFKDNHWNEGSVFLQDEVFHYIEPTIGKHVANLNWFGPTEINRRTWDLIIADLQALSETLETASSIADFRDRIRFVAIETGEAEFAMDFNRNKLALQRVIQQLVKWLRDQLIQHDTVWVLGI